MSAPSPVGVDDDFASGEAGITLWPADDELAGGIDKIFSLVGEHVGWEDLLDDFLDAEVFDGGVIDSVSVLGGDDDVDDAGGLAINVFDGDLGFGIGAEPWGFFAVFAKLGEFAAEAVGEHDGRWHELVGLVTGVSEHDSLVACALLFGFFAFGSGGIDSLGDVGRLDGEEIINEDLVGVEDVIVVCISDATDSLADDAFDVDGGADGLLTDLRDGDFATNNDLIRFHEGLASNTAGLVNLEAGVKNGVRDGVTYFVRMAFADRFGGKNKAFAHRRRCLHHRIAMR